MRVSFPIRGLYTGRATTDQPLGTSFSLQNVRAFDVSDERIRGGQRAGTKLAYSTRVAGNFAVIRLVQITSTYIEPEA